MLRGLPLWQATPTGTMFIHGFAGVAVITGLLQTAGVPLGVLQ
jgi:hypothetical protein